MANNTVLANAFASGGRSSRYGDFVVVTLQSMSFAVPAMEFQQVQNWARARLTQGSVQRDRMAFADRFETVVARSGGGVATKGNRKVLARMVQNMKQAGLVMESWMIPINLDQDDEIKRKPKPVVDDAAAAVEPAAP